ncbi:hypothetical protein PHMEG_00020191 [Phytophthora megakarya]|uniref:Retrotransposon gag domain-containing protein n=1 Tax=Phytophthora megakarya TaxID=4795 RepID=A0A225VSC9_9STRA|nr:hypothetical protein PHMEG_00020191 [Phytophthora megakarya]
MDGSSVGSPNTSATHVARTDCPHLADPEWEALQRLSTVIGEAAVATMLRTLSPTEQHGVAMGFIMREQREVASAKPVPPGETPRKAYLNTYESFKEELKLAFEPRQNEFRSRAGFLDLQQGNYDVQAYAQRVRYLVSNVVTDSMNKATKAVTFMKGLRDEPVKTYLFREYPGTLEAAITLAMQEGFSLKQAKLHTNVPRPPRPAAKTEVMRIYNGHAMLRTAAPSERESHCKVQDDMSNLVILKAKSMTKRADSLRVLVDSGASNYFVRQQSLSLLDFEDKHVPRSQLEVRLATGAIVKTENSVIRAHF